MIKSINYSMKDENDAWKTYIKELKEMKGKILFSDKSEKEPVNSNNIVPDKKYKL